MNDILRTKIQQRLGRTCRGGHRRDTDRTASMTAMQSAEGKASHDHDLDTLGSELALWPQKGYNGRTLAIGTDADLDRHTIIIPTYNERENISLLVGEILNLGLESQIIIVDDSSPDGTGLLVDELAAQHPGVHSIHRPGKLGLGTAHIVGMKAALSHGSSQIVTMDADFSHHPRYIPDLLAALIRFDVVVGSRYVPGGGTQYCTLARQALSWGANLLARKVLSLHAADATAGFRGYRREVLESIPLDEILSNGYSFLIEMLYHCQRRGWRIGEVPIVFENRQRGSSKISRTEILKALQTVTRLGWQRLGGTQASDRR